MKVSRYVFATLLLVIVISGSSISFAAASPTTRRDTVLSYLKDLWVPETGGYGIKAGAIASMSATHWALAILDALNALNRDNLNMTLTKVFINNSQWVETTGTHYYGGFVNVEAGTPDIYAMYHASQALSYLESITTVSPNITAAAIWLNSTKTNDGLFTYTDENGTVTMESIFLVIQSYSSFGQSYLDNNVNKTIITNWIINCTTSQGIKFTPDSNITSLYSTMMGVLTLDTLGTLDQLPNRTSIINWILGLQNLNENSTDYGGFMESSISNITNLQSTTFAVLSLNALGSIGLINNAVVDYILKCQLADGSFKLTTASTDGSLHQLYNAVMSLKALGQLDRLNEENPLVPPGPFPWEYVTVIFLVSVVVILIAIGLKIE